MNKTKHFVGMQKFSSFSTGKNGSRTIAPEENCPLILALTLNLTQTLTPTEGGQFSLGAIDRTPVKAKKQKAEKK